MMDGTPAEVFARGDELKEASLDVPSVADIAAKLRSRGKDVPRDVIRLDELELYAEKMLGGRP